MKPIPRAHLHTVVQAALAEDLAQGDVTTQALFPSPIRARATIVAHQPITVAGVAVAREVFRTVDALLRVTQSVADGTVLKRGAVVMTIEGDGRSLLMAERVAVNFLQRLSGVATLTAAFCAAVRGLRTAILDTRKTTPGLRRLEKWAVALGGGRNHRFSLGDAILIKDNHLALLHAESGNVTEACLRARNRSRRKFLVEVEAKTLEEVRQALAGRADVILLDNMSPAMVRKAVAVIKGQAKIEVSGGITLSTVRRMAQARPDFISVGALTHSAPAVNLSMDLFPLPRTGRRRR
ncbi:MAG: carboxylating nicotinate-nucleotide diphosphorylase [Nitrospiraceae bacterium]|nr:carboxylating nicotinate-nucleotide diphosphorylase [Nitrospiraceae bacterium]